LTFAMETVICALATKARAERESTRKCMVDEEGWWWMPFHPQEPPMLLYQL
jgi:hypothetical protein